MARIRKVEIRNFRSVASLDWFPLPGINCLIGPGDSGKSTILDAIDFSLGARSTLSFCDDDFYRLQLFEPIRITITLGELDSQLRSMEIWTNRPPQGERSRRSRPAGSLKRSSSGAAIGRASFQSRFQSLLACRKHEGETRRGNKKGSLPVASLG